MTTDCTLARYTIGGMIDEAARKRLRAWHLMLAGKTPAEAAEALGIARRTAYTWKARLDEGGIDALRAMTNGRPAQLDSKQLAGIRAAPLQGAMAHGSGTELWTLRRVRELIRRLRGGQVQRSARLAIAGGARLQRAETRAPSRRT